MRRGKASLQVTMGGLGRRASTLISGSASEENDVLLILLKALLNLSFGWPPAVRDKY